MKITLKELKTIIKKILNEVPIEQMSGETNLPVQDYYPVFQKTIQNYHFIYINQSTDVDFLNPDVSRFFNIQEQLYQTFLQSDRDIISNLINVGGIKMPAGVDFNSIPENRKIVLINSEFFEGYNRFKTPQAIMHDIGHSLIDYKVTEKKITQDIISILALFRMNDRSDGAVDVYKSIYGNYYQDGYEDDQLANLISSFLEEKDIDKFEQEMTSQLSYDVFINNIKKNKSQRIGSEQKKQNVNENLLKTRLDSLLNNIKNAVKYAKTNLENNQKVSLLGFGTRI